VLERKMNRHRARALVVDDDDYTREILTTSLDGAGYDCVEAASVDEALAALGTQKFDLAFADIRMPGKSGAELLEQMRGAYPELAVIMVTAVDTASAATEMVRMGAYDYIVKPFNLEQVRLAADRALERRRLERAGREYQRYLEQMTEERAAETRRQFYAMTQVLVRLLEIKAPFSAGHSHRVAEMSRYVARELKMTDDGVRKVYLAALLHDIGVITAADALLHKRGPLTAEELREVRERSALGDEVLRPILHDDEVLKHIRHHAERYDGAGLPDGLKGKSIPLGARIIAVVEAFDAMIRPRPHREALEPAVALAELERCAGTQFDSQVVAVFTELYENVFRNLESPAAPQP
jgi:response regulator RpfG family c-di-GMP phosphodiesterase